MNETGFVDSRGNDTDRTRLPIIPTNRRLIICTTLGAAILLTTLAGIRDTENTPASVKTTLSALKSQSVPPALSTAVVYKKPPSLQLQQTPPVRPTDNDDWAYTDKDYVQNRPDRWEKFETEFGITQPEHSPLLRSLQMAKYNVDRLAFAASEFARSLSGTAQFELNNGRITRVSADKRRSYDDPSSPSMCIPVKMSVGLDMDITQGRTYVGILFVVPLGD